MKSSNIIIILLLSAIILGMFFMMRFKRRHMINKMKALQKPVQPIVVQQPYPVYENVYPVYADYTYPFYGYGGRWGQRAGWKPPIRPFRH